MKRDSIRSQFGYDKQREGRERSLTDDGYSISGERGEGIEKLEPGLVSGNSSSKAVLTGGVPLCGRERDD